MLNEMRTGNAAEEKFSDSLFSTLQEEQLYSKD